MSTPSDPTPPTEPAGPPAGPSPAGFGPAPTPPPPPGAYGYGRPPYGQPAYGQPPYGQPAYGQPMYPVPGVRTNGMAIAAFACALAGFVVYVTAPIGVVLGIVALSQIKRTREDGQGLAVAGIVIGVIVTILGIVIASLAIWFIADVSHKCDTGQYRGQDYQDWCVDNPFTDNNDGGGSNFSG